MSQTNFEIGTVVALKSGGPQMTIESFVWNAATEEYYTDKVECIWFDEKKVLKREAFKTKLLQIQESSL